MMYLKQKKKLKPFWKLLKMEQKTIFKGMWGENALIPEIEKRGYKNIEGLKAEITYKEYMHFLECLPPLRFDGESFYLSEFLTGYLTYFFWKEENKYFCEIKQLILTDAEERF